MHVCNHTLVIGVNHCFIQIRRDRFVQELESYEKQMEEFETFDDLLEVNRYLKRSQGLATRLEEATEKIEGFNLEEDAFEWDRSQYPLKGKLVKVLDPYLNLYKTIVNFQDKHT
jgi:dynein heavy chain